MDTNKLKFDTFIYFCSNADYYRDLFTQMVNRPFFSIKKYKEYVYSHNFSDNKERDRLVKDKIWEWLMSYKYEEMCKNDLYAVLGYIKKGR